MALPHMPLPRPWRSRLFRLLSPVFLVGLVVAAGTDDVLIPVVAHAPRAMAEVDETVSSPVGNYCRIRRDSLSEWRLALFADVPGRDASSASCQSTFRLSPPPHLSSSLLGEHGPCLARRSRAPGLRAA